MDIWSLIINYKILRITRINDTAAKSITELVIYTRILR